MLLGPDLLKACARANHLLKYCQDLLKTQCEQLALKRHGQLFLHLCLLNMYLYDDMIWLCQSYIMCALLVNHLQNFPSHQCLNCAALFRKSGLILSKCKCLKHKYQDIVINKKTNSPSSIAFVFLLKKVQFLKLLETQNEA